MSSLLLTGAGPSNGGGGGGGFVGPLDGVLSGAVMAVAFGHRLIGASDPDVAIIRNVTSSAEGTFKATTGAFGADVLTLLGSDDGRYKTVYDQIAGAALTEQSTNNGGKAATAGVLETLGTGYAGLFQSASMFTSAIFVQAQPFTVFLVVHLNARGINTGVIRFGAGLTGIGFNGTNWTVRSGGGSTINTGVAATLSTDLIVRVVFDGASSHIAINNGSPTTINPGTTGIGSGGAEDCTIGRGSAAGAMNGKVGFAGLWSGRKDDGAIETALGTVW